MIAYVYDIWIEAGFPPLTYEFQPLERDRYQAELERAMSRKLTSHRVNGLNECLDIAVLDEPGEGNACHRYAITGFDTDKNPSAVSPDGCKASYSTCEILFQNGPILEAGANGISNEALLAIVEDRLLGFQSGPFACRENAIALTKLQEAMMWLLKRTRDRMVRGVEGTNQK